MSEQPATRPYVPTVDDKFNLGRRRAARHEKRGLPPFVLDEERGITVQAPPGLPVGALEPLLGIDLDLPLLWRILQQAQQQGGTEAAGMALIDFFVGNPNLPKQALTAVQEILTNLFGADGYAALVAWKPEIEDLRDLAVLLLGHYGASLGEAFGSSGSSTANGEQPKPTSAGSTDSTSPTSTPTPAALPGSAPGD